jgi:hypothetical protein
VEAVEQQRKTVEELKEMWKALWVERIDDHVRAEGIANKDYSDLFVERGTVILATRNFKLLSFREVLERSGVVDADRFAPADPRVGGWGKFIRTSISSRKVGGRVRRAVSYFEEKKERQHLKKGGRGWLHV